MSLCFFGEVVSDVQRGKTVQQTLKEEPWLKIIESRAFLFFCLLVVEFLSCLPNLRKENLVRIPHNPTFPFQARELSLRGSWLQCRAQSLRQAGHAASGEVEFLTRSALAGCSLGIILIVSS